MPFTSEDEDTDAEESNPWQGKLVGKDCCTAKKVYATLHNIYTVKNWCDDHTNYCSHQRYDRSLHRFSVTITQNNHHSTVTQTYPALCARCANIASTYPR